MTETENRFHLIDRDELNSLLYIYLKKYPFVTSVYLCRGIEEKKPYVLLLEVPKEPDDKDLYMEFRGDISFPPAQYLVPLSRVYIDDEAPLKKAERAYGEWMWFDISDINRIDLLGDFVLPKEPKLVYGRRTARNDAYIFPELRFDTLRSFAEQWAGKWPVIRKVTLFRYHTFYETGLFQQNPRKYALLFDIMGDEPLLAEFETAADTHRTIYDETVGGTLYREFMPKAFEDVYMLRPPVDYKKEWSLLVNRPRRRAPWHFEGNPSWLLYDRDAEKLKPADGNITGINRETLNRKTVGDIGRQGGIRNKRNIVLDEVLDHLLRNEPQRCHHTSSKLWKHLKITYSESKPYQVISGSLYIRTGVDETIITEGNNHNDKEKSISFRTFCRYVREAKNRIR